VAGVCCAVVGAAITVGISGLTLGSDALVGVLLLLAGDLSMAVYFVVQKPLLLTGRLPPLTATAYAYGFGSLQLLVVIGLFVEWHGACCVSACCVSASLSASLPLCIAPLSLPFAKSYISVPHTPLLPLSHQPL
jgi:drug/metabolite transporter (DMT)-like permease